MVVEVEEFGELISNGLFDDGFDENGVGLQWESFETGGANINFSPETADVFINSGDAAQRISVEFANEADQHGGIYQTLEVVPNEVYTLTMNGQVRTGFGDVDDSSYGYRMQYAIDPMGGSNWRSIPAEDLG